MATVATERAFERSVVRHAHEVCQLQLRGEHVIRRIADYAVCGVART